MVQALFLVLRIQLVDKIDTPTKKVPVLVLTRLTFQWGNQTIKK